LNLDSEYFSPIRMPRAGAASLVASQNPPYTASSNAPAVSNQPSTSSQVKREPYGNDVIIEDEEDFDVDDDMFFELDDE
jgi:hypothetical protein